MPNYKGMHEDELKENIRLRRRLEQVERENERLIEELSQTKKEVTDREDERDEARRLLEEAPCHPPQQRDALEAFHRIITWSNEDYHHDGMHSRQADTKTVRRTLTNPAVPEAINVVFDGPPGPTAGRFIEVETDNGESVRVGEWIERDDGLWALRIDRAIAQSGEGRAGWKLVPVEPTEAMLKAASDAFNAAKEPEDWSQGGDIGDDNADVYRAMLAAAPEPGPENGD